MRRDIGTGFCLLASIALTGCAAAPRVGHTLITDPAQLDGNQLATYALQELVVTIKATTTGEGDKRKTTLSATVDREDHQGLRIALFRRNRIGVETDVTIKKFENTDIPSEVTVKVNDTRADLVAKAGQIVVGLVKLGVPFSESPAVLPARLNLSRLIGGPDRQGGLIRRESNIVVEYGPIPVDAVETRQENIAGNDSYFYYAACRSATLTFAYGEETHTYTFKVSDPNYLQRQRMPVDGKITMHSQCGVSVTGKLSGDDAASALALTSALIAQGQAISDAIEAANKSSDDD